MLERIGQHFARVHRERSAREIEKVEKYDNGLRELVAQYLEGSISHDEFNHRRSSLNGPQLDFRRAAEKLGKP